MSDPKRRATEGRGPEAPGPEARDPASKVSAGGGRTSASAAHWQPPAEPCPSRETLAAWADGELPEAEAATLAAHLPDCAICRVDLAELQAFQAVALDIAAQMDRDLAALRPDRSAQAAARDAASRLSSAGARGDLGGTEDAVTGEAATGSWAGPLSGLRRVLASFQAPQPLPAGLRARGGAGTRGQGAGSVIGSKAGSGGAQHCSFSADEGRVIISCAIRSDDETGRYRLNGRVHGLSPSAVQLQDEAGGLLARAELDANGAFQLTDLGGGRRLLRFDGPGLVLELDRAIEIGPMEAA